MTPPSIRPARSNEYDEVARVWMDARTTALFAPGVGEITDDLVQAANASQIIGFDGTFWTNEELRAIRPAAHIGGGGQVDVAENGRHDHAEGPDRDQRQPERR